LAEYTFTRADVDKYARALKSESEARMALEYQCFDYAPDFHPSVFFGRKCFDHIKRVTGFPSRRVSDRSLSYDEIDYDGVLFCAFVPEKEVI
jgi:hypothetical protein